MSAKENEHASTFEDGESESFEFYEVVDSDNLSQEFETFENDAIDWDLSQDAACIDDENCNQFDCSFRSCESLPFLSQGVEFKKCIQITAFEILFNPLKIP